MASDSVKDPFAAFLFSVAVGSAQGGAAGSSVEVGGFSEVSGLGFECEVETLRVGGMNEAELQLLGPSKYATRLVLKRGLGDASYLWGWYADVMQGRIVRRAVTITLRHAHGLRPYAWTFAEACPVKWSGPSLQAGTSAIAFESIELVHRGLQQPAGQGH
jgi:phage tail-like protein